MKKISIDFYSYRPRLKVSLYWVSDIVPNVGDEIRIDNKFIKQWDKKYFKKWEMDFERVFKVKKRIWAVDKRRYLDGRDVQLELDWNEKEKKRVQKYLKSKNN